VPQGDVVSNEGACQQGGGGGQEACAAGALS
jgi:hypothetical protein